jgi:hypothetical protein
MMHCPTHRCDTAPNAGLQMINIQFGDLNATVSARYVTADEALANFARYA